MTRAIRATSRTEFATRFAALQTHARTGRQALAAQGAFSILWHGHSTAGGFVPLTAKDAAAVLEIDVRTWHEFARLLEAAGLLRPCGSGYEIPWSPALEGTTTARGTTGFVQTHTDVYGAVQARVRRAAQLGERSSTYALATLGALEVFRVTRANWANGSARWSTAAAAQECSVRPQTWAGYLTLLGRALVITRDGGRTRVLGWQQWQSGPSAQRSIPAAESREPHEPSVSVDNEQHEPSDLSEVKALALLVKDVPPTPKLAPTPMRLRRGDHQNLPKLFQALEERVPAAAFARWRRPVRQQLSIALDAIGGDVDALAVELTRHQLRTAHDVPAILAHRCAAAVGIIRTRQASAEAARQAKDAQNERSQELQDAAERRQQAERDRDALTAAAGAAWPALVDTAARALFGEGYRPSYRSTAERSLIAAARQAAHERPATAADLDLTELPASRVLALLTRAATTMGHDDRGTHLSVVPRHVTTS